MSHDASSLSASTSSSRLRASNVWGNVRVLLVWGHKPQRIAAYYGFRGLDAKRIGWRNFSRWHIDAKEGSRRGPRCPACRKRKPCFKAKYCKTCYYDSRRLGRRVGPRHHAWKGGITLTEEYVRLSPEYERFRDYVLARDKGRCVVCDADSADGVPVQVDHIIPQVARPDLRLEPWNARTLCSSCHKKTETYGIAAKYYRYLFRAGVLQFWIE